MGKFLKLRSINRISDKWLYIVKVTLENYLTYVGCPIDEDKTLAKEVFYCKK